MKGERIKLFVDAHCFDTEYQGMQTFVCGLYREILHQDTMDIYFGTDNADNILKAFPGLPPARVLMYKKRKPSVLRYLFDIPGILKNNGFHYAHFQYMSPQPVRHCKYIVTMHDVLFNDFRSSFSWQYRISRNLLFNRSMQQAAIKTTVSDYSGKRISRHFNIAEEQLAIIPNGISSMFGAGFSRSDAREIIFKKYGLDNFILFVSRIEPRKNHLLLLEKYLELELYKQNISLVFIGQQSIPVAALQKRISQLTAGQQLFFRWFEQVDQQDLEAFYRSCRLFVYPSKAEGFGIPPLEAAVCKVPVLCSNTTAMQDYGFFKPFTFDPENEVEFGNQLKAILESPVSASRLESIAEEVLEKYSWKNSAAAFCKLLV